MHVCRRAPSSPTAASMLNSLTHLALPAPALCTLLHVLALTARTRSLYPLSRVQTRAIQFYSGDTVESKLKAMPVLLHGDAAFAGQVSTRALQQQWDVRWCVIGAWWSYRALVASPTLSSVLCAGAIFVCSREYHLALHFESARCARRGACRCATLPCASRRQQPRMRSRTLSNRLCADGAALATAGCRGWCTRTCSSCACRTSASGAPSTSSSTTRWATAPRSSGGQSTSCCAAPALSGLAIAPRWWCSRQGTGEVEPPAPRCAARLRAAAGSSGHHVVACLND
jgi:hypothetical protein